MVEMALIKNKNKNNYPGCNINAKHLYEAAGGKGWRVATSVKH